MADMNEPYDLALGLERVIGSVGRVEVKVDTMIADLQRRVGDGERDRQELHGRVTTIAGAVERNTAQIASQGEDIKSAQAAHTALSDRVGGAPARWMPILLSAAAVMLTVVGLLLKL